MPNPTQVEKWAEACFLKMNMITHRARNSGTKRGNMYVSQNNDIFGVFDVIAIDPVTGHLYMFQVTSSYKQTSKKRKDVREWFEKYGFTKAALKTITVGILVYSSQKSRTDARRVDRFFYREEYDWEWMKCEPMVIPDGVK